MGQTRSYAGRPMRGLQALAGLYVFEASAAVLAGPVVFTSPGPGPARAAGSVIEVSWSGVPKSSEEGELLLSLDGGRRVALRLTEQISPRGRSYFWRVPNLSARRAALVLRMGIAGREVESAPSAPFEILLGPSRPDQRIALRAGELWLAEAGATREADPLPAASLDSRPPEWAPLSDRTHSIALTGAALFGARWSDRGVPIRCDSSVIALRSAVLSRLPRLAPLRI